MKDVQQPLSSILKLSVLLSGIIIGSSFPIAMANPVLQGVAAGSASVTQTPGLTQIQQNSTRAILHWQSFNIGAGERTHFQQPVNGVALNRIDPTQGASKIFGQLTATGQIILVNQSGIFFGPGSFVNVGSIIASTSDIANANFLAGKYIFDQPSTTAGSIVNKGTIKATEYGLVALVGTAIQNDGTIQANLGKVVLASGNKFTFDFSGNNLINFVVNEPASAQGKSPEDDKPLKNGVNNTGSIIADGGRILLTARAAHNVLDNVVNNSGILQARTVSKRHGVIILAGDDTGTVRVSGKIDVSGRTSGQHGGVAKVLGKHVRLDKSAVIDASGDLGGGTILVGGNFRGLGPDVNAYDTLAASGAALLADAISRGNGGKVAVWADNFTGFYGSISAKGGALSGAGGTAETSGKNNLDVVGARVNLSAAHGKFGNWLLDPTDVTICAAGPGCPAPFSGNESFAGGTYTPTGSSATITTADIVTNLTSANVIITTSSAGPDNGDIFLNAPLTWSGTGSLSLIADRNITIGASINSNSATAGIDMTATGGNIIFTNTPTINVGGQITLNSPVLLNSDATLSSSSAGINFVGTVNGAHNLVVAMDPGGPGSVEFGASVGAITPLTSLLVSGRSGPTSQAGRIYLGHSSGGSPSIVINTTGNQTYYGYALLTVSSVGQSITLNAANVTFANNVALAPNNISVDDNSIFLAPAIFNVNTTGTASFTGSLGTTSRVGLRGLNITSANTILHAGNQTITDPGGYQVRTTATTQGYNTALTLQGNVDMRGPGTFTFNGNINGAFILSLQPTVGVTLAANIGNSTPLAGLVIVAPLTLSGNVSITTTGSMMFQSVSGTGLTTNGGSLILAGDVTTSGSQTYNNLVIFDNAIRNFSTTSGNITFNAGITSNPGQDVAVSGSGNNIFTFAGAYTNVNSITVSNSANTGTLSIQTADPTLTWNMTGAGSGSVTGVGSLAAFTYSGIRNFTGSATAANNFLLSGSGAIGITGGGGTNTFTFSAGTSYSGTINSGSANNTFNFGNNSIFAGTIIGNSTAVNTLNFGSYATPITLRFGNSQASGQISNSAGSTIAAFSNFTSGNNSVIGDLSRTSRLILPTKGSPNTLTIQSASIAGQGSIGSLNDPFNFSGFNNFVGQNGNIDVVNFASGFVPSAPDFTIDINGVTNSFTGFAFSSPTPTPISTPNVIISAITGSTSQAQTSTTTLSTSTDTYVYESTVVDQNITDVETQLDVDESQAYSVGCVQ